MHRVQITQRPDVNGLKVNGPKQVIYLALQQRTESYSAIALVGTIEFVANEMGGIIEVTIVCTRMCNEELNHNG